MPKKVSLKPIVAEIDKVLKEMEDESLSKSARTEVIESAKRQLRGVREVVIGVCVGPFDFPAE